MGESVKKSRSLTGSLLKRKRELLQLSQEDVAERAGISAYTLNKIENGWFAWDIDLHLKLCDILQLAKVNK